MDWKVLTVGIQILYYIGMVINNLINDKYKIFIEEVKEQDFEGYAIFLGIFGKFVYEIIISMIMIIVIIYPKVKTKIYFKIFKFKNKN